MVKKLIFLEKSCLFLDSNYANGLFPGLYNLTLQGYKLVLVTEDSSEGFNAKIFRSQKINFCDVININEISEFIIKSLIEMKSSRFIGKSPRFLEVVSKIDGRLIDVNEMESDFLEISSLITTEPRVAKRSRKTNETDIQVEVNLDGKGQSEINTGIEFFDHMLDQICRHGGIDLKVIAVGDLGVDEHHTVEDVAICLGESIKEALADKIGIGRYGFVVPMDESLAKTAIDFSGRPSIQFKAQFTREIVGGFPTEMVEHFFSSLADAMRATLHIEVTGSNEHHMIEGIFKSVAKSLSQAVKKTNGNELPSTKGVL